MAIGGKAVNVAHVHRKRPMVKPLRIGVLIMRGKVITLKLIMTTAPPRTRLVVVLWVKPQSNAPINNSKPAQVNI